MGTKSTVFLIQHFLLLCYVYSHIVGVVHGISVKENGFDSIAKVAVDFAETLQSPLIDHYTPQDRGKFLKLLGREAVFRSVSSSRASNIKTIEDAVHHPFRYSNDWTGTSLQVVDISTAVLRAVPYKKSRNGSFVKYRWPMGRWPDPILRRSADPVATSLFGSEILRQACDTLRNTAVAEGAVGLAAQQCGVNARIIYLGIATYFENSHDVLVNPRIIRRSSEMEMKVWKENCLVLPPSFQATVLRDAWVDVEYQDWKGKLPFYVKRMHGELARALQHEMDHDRGILVTDHVSLDQLENDQMRLIEQPGHESRMAIAYDRFID